MRQYTSLFSSSPKRKLRNNTDVIDYFASDNEIYEQAEEHCSKQDIYIDIADILGQKYQYRINIGKGDLSSRL